MSSVPLSGITPGRMTEPETAAKVWTYPDEEQGIFLKHITTTKHFFMLHQFPKIWVALPGKATAVLPIPVSVCCIFVLP